MVAFHATLSERSVQMRYLTGMSYQQRTATSGLHAFAELTMTRRWR